jgi:hypothetical protein
MPHVAALDDLDEFEARLLADFERSRRRERARWSVINRRFLARIALPGIRLNGWPAAVRLPAALARSRTPRSRRVRCSTSRRGPPSPSDDEPDPPPGLTAGRLGVPRRAS